MKRRTFLKGAGAAAAQALAPEILWQPQEGPQRLAMECPIEDVLYGGARGGGKTDWILMDWVEHQETFGEHCNGLLFRKTFEPEMKEIIRRSKDLFPALGARYRSGAKEWRFPNGSLLGLRHLEDETGADAYIGHQYTWLGFDQLEQFTAPDPIDKIRGSLRSAYGIPCVSRSTANPGGKGHQWVKHRYIENRKAFVPFFDTEKEVHRVFIPAKLQDNPKLLENDPDYPRRLRGTGPAWLVRAWLEGDWDVAPGAFLEGIWDPDVHRIKPFIPPYNWKRWRALDWGSARPYSVGWYAMDFDGSIFRYRELYGWGGKPNKGTRESAYQVADKIRATEADERRAGAKFVKNPAGTDIWGVKGLRIRGSQREETIAAHFADKGIQWAPASVGQGSRVLGAQEVIHRLYEKSFFVTANCRHFLRTVPLLMPDVDNLDDVDTEQEDHPWDELRYSLRSRRAKPKDPKAEEANRRKKIPKRGTYDYLVYVDELEKKRRAGKRSHRRLVNAK